ncbi:MAG TPA: glycogen/starch synthase [Candidatus Gallibacteroides avistercoris]|uniref:starch synthase n=1 Tax=Candidatus Gallibacteroides avistercoris TaxID=2840833 RepID=A0A9D1M6F1_9BACT|nr:glycogen/starch synthase [Candidatus Gallibacteroides avistercoris]
MTKATKVLFIAQEITPYLPDSEIATLCRNLPQGIQERGHEIRTFMPKYGNINERRNQLHEVIRLSGMNLIINDTDHPLIIKVASIQSARMQVYFIDNDDYFQRKQVLTDDNGNEFEDNDERSIFFVRGVMETVKKLRWAPDIIHCHGWLTALAPLYIKKAYAEDPSFRNSKIIYSTYDNGFQVPYGEDFAEKIQLEGVEPEDVAAITGKPVDFETLTKLAIDFSDGVIQGSQHINNEILSYVQGKNIPFLPYQSADTYIAAYDHFYDEVWEKNNQ